MNPHTMNRKLGWQLLLGCFLYLPISVQSQLFQNHYQVFELVAGSSLQYEFTASTPNFEISGGESGIIDIQAISDSLYVLTFSPEYSVRGQEAIRIQGVDIRENGQTGIANHLLDISITEGHIQTRPDFIFTQADRPTLVHVLSNDESHLRSVFIKAIPSISNGTIEFTPGTTELVFSPDPGFTGRASFTYLACDAADHCALGYATVWVNDPQSDAERVRLFVESGEELMLPLDPASNRILNPAHGQVTLSYETLRYKANAGFVGKDSLTVTQDGKSVQVQIEVLSATKEGFARKDHYYVVPGGVIALDPLENDLFAGSEYGCIELADPQLGVLRPIGNSNRYAYSAPDNFVGVDRISYRVLGPDCAGSGDESEIFVHVGYFEPLYDQYSFNVAAGMPLLIENEIPISSFVWRIKEEPTYGSTFLVKEDTVVAGQLSPAPNTLVYTPNADIQAGTDRMVLEYCLGEGGGCAFQKNVEIIINIEERDNEAVNYCVMDCVWPGDANADGEVGVSDLLSLGRHMGETGIARVGTTVDRWIGQGGDAWDGGVDLKHVDTNGDGLISSLDTVAIRSYTGRTNSVVSFVPVIPEATIDLVYEGGPVKAGQLVEIEVHLGSAEQPITDLVGISFPFAFNPELIDGSTIQFHYDADSWFAHYSPVLGMGKLKSPGLFVSGMTRTNRRPGLGYGKVGTSRFVITEDINGIRPGTITLGGGMANILDKHGNVTPVRVSKLEIPFEPGINTVTSTTEVPQDADLLSVFPNPARDLLQWQWKSLDRIDSIEVIDLAGKRMFFSTDGSLNQIGVGDWPVGMYILQVKSDQRISRKKVQVVH